MKRVLLFLFSILSISLFAENKVTLSVNKDKVTAVIDINPGEYIIFNDQFLFLSVVSEHYNYKFSGFPDGELQENGDVYYSGKLKLKGDLTLKEGVSPGDYTVEVILGYQTCDKEGYCNIPVEISESLVVPTSKPMDNRIKAAMAVILLCLILILIIKRKRN